MGNKWKSKGISLSFYPEAHSRLQCEGWSPSRNTGLALLRQEMRCQDSGNVLGKNTERKESHREKYNSKLKIINFLKALKISTGVSLNFCWKLPMPKMKFLGLGQDQLGHYYLNNFQSSHRTWREFSSEQPETFSFNTCNIQVIPKTSHAIVVKLTYL